MNKKKFTIFHISLSEPIQLELGSEKITREYWIRESLSRDLKFKGRNGIQLYWTPQKNIGDYIFGVIQKKQLHQLHVPPSEGGDERIVEEWQGAYVLIDPRNHENGQRASVENDVIGKPSILIKSLFDRVNQIIGKPYHIEAEPIFDGKDFWEFSKKHGERLRYIRFDFVTPNMWETKRKLDKELRKTREETGAQRVVTEFKSIDGIITSSQIIKDGVSYTEEGAGEIRAKSLDGTPFSSKERPKISSVPEPTEEENKNRRSWFETLADRILGYVKLEEHIKDDSASRIIASDKSGLPKDTK